MGGKSPGKEPKGARVRPGPDIGRPTGGKVPRKYLATGQTSNVYDVDEIASTVPSTLGVTRKSPSPPPAILAEARATRSRSRKIVSQGGKAPKVQLASKLAGQSARGPPTFHKTASGNLANPILVLDSSPGPPANPESDSAGTRHLGQRIIMRLKI